MSSEDRPQLEVTKDGDVRVSNLSVSISALGLLSLVERIRGLEKAERGEMLLSMLRGVSGEDGFVLFGDKGYRPQDVADSPFLQREILRDVAAASTAKKAEEKAQEEILELKDELQDLKSRLAEAERYDSRPSVLDDPEY